ncbi:hypothetical protein FM037_14445 [Shewanella psychropiezotolerans]|uniref:Uncharacterized protein n=1 Tax=Shewanella psychropiezotolerans TaxID=2593655 RepID=A0ABX5WYP2_9GAMM|nr:MULTISPECIES: hypothetical protein [Shewanella]MPY23948.1 hypothetical protein [Shewanella sp. YLB-07]QDO84214.1 hypothetical protein FM037_14445 [Shewanella psychropiezotolerans]
MQADLLSTAKLKIIKQLQQPDKPKSLRYGTGLSPWVFLVASESLWRHGELCGVVDDGCCQNACGQACVSYMDQDRKWSKVKHRR